MKKSKEKEEGKGTWRKRILDFIEEHDSANLKQLVDLTRGPGESPRRNTITYNIKCLCEDKKIRAFVKGAGLKDEEIFYSKVLDNYPQTIHEIKDLIECMCQGKNRKVAAPAYEDFINRCAEIGIPTDDANKLAYTLIAGIKPNLKEKVALLLAYKPLEDDIAYLELRNFGKGKAWSINDFINDDEYWSKI